MRIRVLANLGIYAWLLLAGTPQAADTITLNREYQLKSAYLFHFAELATWPDAVAVNICLLGNSPLRQYLPALEGLSIDNKPVHVRLEAQGSLQDCQILVLSDNQYLSKSLSEQARNEHILLVSDAENFARNGGMIQFTLRDNKLKLVVNLAMVREAGLRLSSKLLRMAEIL